MDYRSTTTKSGIDRKALLRKSERQLLKECKKHSIDPKLFKKSTLNKRDLVDLIITHSNPNYVGYSKSKKKKKKKKRMRSHSIAETLTKTRDIKPNKPIKLKTNTKQKTAYDTAKYDAIFPELRVQSLLRLNSIPLNESIETKTDEIFVEHMTLSDIQRLQINDCIDFRANNGLVFGATIMDKYGSVISVTFINDNNDLQNIECDYNKELYRFAEYESLSTRKRHTMIDLEIGSTVDINPRHIINEWMIGEIVKTHIGFIQIEYNYKHKKHLYWVHTDNTLEIAPYLTHYDITNLLDNLDIIDYDDHKIEWNYHDIKDWFNGLQNGKFSDNIQYKMLKDAFATYNIDYHRLSQINGLTLELLGIDDENDRKVILNEIHKLTGSVNKDKQHEIELLKLKEEIAFIKNGIKQQKDK